MRPLLLDLYCKAGGASMGYYKAGFDVIGVDIELQPHYPFEFYQSDAIEFLSKHYGEFAAISASPPCQKWSTITKTAKTEWKHKDLIGVTREVLVNTGKPYVIENVPQAPLINPVMLCGTMFGLLIVRHRLFESNIPLSIGDLKCNHVRKVVKHGRRPDRERHYHAITGHFSDVPWARKVMECPWMNQSELAEAIPPAYTKFIGEQLIRCVVQYD